MPSRNRVVVSLTKPGSEHFVGVLALGPPVGVGPLPDSIGVPIDKEMGGVVDILADDGSPGFRVAGQFRLHQGGYPILIRQQQIQAAAFQPDLLARVANLGDACRSRAMAWPGIASGWSWMRRWRAASRVSPLKPARKGWRGSCRSCSSSVRRKTTYWGGSAGWSRDRVPTPWKMDRDDLNRSPSVLPHKGTRNDHCPYSQALPRPYSRTSEH